MPIGLDNNGYNDVFRRFAEFAQGRVDAGDTKAIAAAKLEKAPLGGRKILALSQATNDSVHNWTRGFDQWSVNDRTRKLFRAAVAHMFGGEDRIPAEVKDAMLLGDYGAGKPLTARRILAVKNAIDANGTAKARAERMQQAAIDERYGKFDYPLTMQAAVEDGYTQAELKDLAKAVNFLRAAKPELTEAAAYSMVTERFSPANRLLQYGGNFLKTPANFARGLQLLEDFRTWYSDLRDFEEKSSAGRGKDYSQADTATKLNYRLAFTVSNHHVQGAEALIFRDLAADPKADLSRSGEDLFGFASNASTRFYCRDCHQSMTGTMVSLPADQRRVVYAVFDAFLPVAGNKEEADELRGKPGAEKTVKCNQILVARCIKNMDALKALMAKGPLTTKDIVKTCFPDMKHKGDCDLKSLNDFDEWIQDRANEEFGEWEGANAAISIQGKMAQSGCTVKEAIESYKTGKPLPSLPHVAGYSCNLGEYREGGFGQMASDLQRGYNYGLLDADGIQQEGEENMILGRGDYKNTLTFPDGDKISASSLPEHRDGIQVAVQKVKDLCGKAHPMQANIVAYNLSQSANGPLNRALQPYGIFASEHVVLDYDISRNDENGDITIKYSSPKNLPLEFSWSTTISVDGHCSTTPLVVTPPVRQLDKAAAKAMVADACQRRGVELDKNQAARAADVLRRYCTDMPAKNAKMFANFVLTLDLDADMDDLAEVAEDMARNIRSWREFGAGLPKIAGIEEALKDNLNDQMADAFADVEKDNPGTFDAKGGEISNQLRADAHRLDYTINGEKIDKVMVPGRNTVDPDATKDKVVTAFTNAVRGKAMRQGLSSIFNQSIGSCAMSLANRFPFAETTTKSKHSGKPLSEFPGIGNIVSRNNPRLYRNMLLRQPFESSEFSLDVAEGGKTATITAKSTAALLSGTGPEIKAEYGKVTFTQTFTVDMSGDKPVVKDAKIAQSFEI